MGFRFLFPNRKITYSFAATSLAAFLQVLSYAMPFWFIVHSHLVSFYVGLFFMLVCPTALTESVMSECKIMTYETILQSGTGDERSALEALYMLMLILKIVAGVSCGLILGGGFITLLTAGCRVDPRKWNYQIACVSQIVSGILALGVTGFMAAVAAGTPTANLGASNLPWSLIAIGIGGFFSVVAFIIMCKALCNWEVPGLNQVDLQVVKS